MTSAARDAADAHRASRFAADVEFARSMAEEAGRLLFERYERVERIDFKSAKDVVTEVDHLSEERILGEIRRTFPGDGILAEESGAHQGSGTHVRVDAPAPEGSGAGASRDPAAAASRALAAGRTWIVDPLDGTVNYANGIPFFCVSIGLVVDGRPAAGAVHDPMRGETFSAVADGGAWLGDAHHRTTAIRASEKEALTDWVVHLALGGRAVATRARAVRKAIRVSRTMGSSALGLAYVANGRFDAFVQSGGMSAWDVAAAGLIAERAGARVTDTGGGTWFDVDRATRAFGLVAAPASRHADILQLSGEPAKA
ncbi:MAG TPA: inositol monophosphatase family protein [Candidatus Limnocylindrales bacterium]|nr:inositol monophosphatase family protein [Candidatus Limnocylindrales bacterium]